MKDELLNQALKLPVEERFDLMMALLDSLPDDHLLVLSDEQIADLASLVEHYRSYPEPSVQYDRVLDRLRSLRQSQGI